MQEFVGRVALEWARQAADDQTERAIARAIAQFTADWQVRISVALQRGNAYALIHRGRRDRQRAGRQCRARGHMHEDVYDSSASLTTPDRPYGSMGGS